MWKHRLCCVVPRYLGEAARYYRCRCYVLRVDTVASRVATETANTVKVRHRKFAIYHVAPGSPLGFFIGVCRSHNATLLRALDLPSIAFLFHSRLLIQSRPLRNSESYVIVFCFVFIFYHITSHCRKNARSPTEAGRKSLEAELRSNYLKYLRTWVQRHQALCTSSTTPFIYISSTRYLKYNVLAVRKFLKNAMYASAKNSCVLIFLSSNNKYLSIRWKFMQHKIFEWKLGLRKPSIIWSDLSDASFSIVFIIPYILINVIKTAHGTNCVTKIRRKVRKHSIEQYSVFK